MKQKLETNQKSFVIFVNAIKSDKTKVGYIDDLNKFLAFTKMPDYDTLAKLDTDTIQEFLENYVLKLKSKKLTSIRTRLAGPELFFDMNKKLFYKKILHKLLPSDDNPISGNVAFTNEDIQSMLSNTFKPRTKAIIHFVASTGIRPGAFNDPPFQLKHLEKIEDCQSIKVYDNSKEGYFAFLTPEATESLSQYLESRKLNGETLTPESYIFHTYNTKTKFNEYLTGEGVSGILKRLIKKAGIARIKINAKNYDKAVNYGFRKRFNTILKLNNEVNSNIVEKLMAHKNGLDGRYLQPTREQLFKEFKKAIRELTIDPSKRQEVEIEAQQKKITELSLRDDRIGELEERLDKIDREAELDNEIHETTKEINKLYDILIKDFDDDESFEKMNQLTKNRDRLYQERDKLGEEIKTK